MDVPVRFLAQQFLALAERLPQPNSRSPQFAAPLLKVTEAAVNDARRPDGLLRRRNPRQISQRLLPRGPLPATPRPLLHRRLPPREMLTFQAGSVICR